MSGTALFAASVAVYAGIPLLLAVRRTPFQFLLLYAYIASVLTIGGLLGAMYVLPVGGITLSPGQVAYGAFMFSTLITVIVGRDLQVVRNVVLLTVAVDVLVFAVFKISHLALSEPGVPSRYGVSAAVFDESLRVVVLGGVLIILELLGLLAVLELAKRRLPRWWMAPVYVLAYVVILVLDGVLFPIVVTPPAGGLADLISDGVPARLVLAGAYAIPLVLFVALYPRLVQRFEETPLNLHELVSLRRDPMLERLDEQEAELRVRTEEAASATATVSRIIDAASNTLIVATDPGFVITHFNRGAEELLGRPARTAIGRPVTGFYEQEELARHAEELGVRPLLEEVVPALVRRGTPSDWTLMTGSGERRTMSLSFTEIRDDGRLIGYLCAGEDVSARARTESALTEALRRESESVARLEEADRVKDEVVSTISHELRTPISSIQGYSEMLTAGDFGDLDPEQEAALGKVLRNTARLSSLVDDLLHLDRAQSGQLELRRVPTDMVAITREAWESLQQVSRERALTLELVVPDEPVSVLGDPRALERVVLNLGSNAIKFTPDDGRVTASVARTEAGCVLIIADTGVGIAEADQPRVLGRFYRSSDARRLAVPGSGLGLSVVDAIVAGHGGTIDIDSEPGRGTTVTVVLPLAEEGPDG